LCVGKKERERERAGGKTIREWTGPECRVAGNSWDLADCLGA
jgi:hypothetical protein